MESDAARGDVHPCHCGSGLALECGGGCPLPSQISAGDHVHRRYVCRPECDRGGTYASITVKGVCYVAPGTTITVGNVFVASGATLDAQSASTVNVGQNITALPGSTLLLGCVNNHRPEPGTSVRLRDRKLRDQRQRERHRPGRDLRCAGRRQHHWQRLPHRRRRAHSGLHERRLCRQQLADQAQHDRRQRHCAGGDARLDRRDLQQHRWQRDFSTTSLSTPAHQRGSASRKYRRRS